MLRNCDGQVKEMWPEIQGLGLKNAALKPRARVVHLHLADQVSTIHASRRRTNSASGDARLYNSSGYWEANPRLSSTES